MITDNSFFLLRKNYLIELNNKILKILNKSYANYHNRLINFIQIIQNYY